MGRPGGRRCYLCSFSKRKAYNEDKENIPMCWHGFPTHAATRSLWMKICNLDEKRDIISSRKFAICSRHFTQQDYIDINARMYGGQLKLKFGAYPTIDVPNPCNSSPTDNRIRDNGETQFVNLTAPPKYSVSSLDSNLRSMTSVIVEHRTCSNAEKSNCEASSSGNINLQITSVGGNGGMKLSSLQSSDNIVPKLPISQEASETCRTPKSTRRTGIRYPGDLKSPDVSTPRKAKRAMKLVISKHEKQKKQIKVLQQKNRRLNKKIESLQDLIKHLQKKNFLTEDAVDTLMESVPEEIKELVKSQIQKKRKRKYSPAIRRFALTLQFYSSRAYNYVRRKWKNLLPEPSTIRKWYAVMNGKPGFTEEALQAIKSKNSIKQLQLNLVIDEMSIREQLTFLNNEFYGGVNLGTEFRNDGDNVPLAKSVLCFMAVAMNEGWKIPIGYFLIKNLNGTERANLLQRCLELFEDTGAKVNSLTFDGAPVNFNMCSVLGANFSSDPNTFKPYFTNKCNGETIWVFPDACHMIKLIRNTLGDKKVLIDNKGRKIQWRFIVDLWNLQQKERLHLANKLTKKHIEFNDNRMSVKLAVQTLSESVYNSLRFLHNKEEPQFADCMATAEFCHVFNNIFDLLNCRSRFGKKNKYNIPLNEHNYSFLKESADSFEKYILGLKDESGAPILNTNRRTGFIGLIICLRNLFQLYNDIKQRKSWEIKYLLSFKLSQDYIETFFSAIRSRGGFNNNPNAKQFEGAYKRLLLKNELRPSQYSNCLAEETDENGVEMLSVSSSLKVKQYKDTSFTDDEPCSIFDHDYINTLWALSPIVEEIIKYIAGFTVGKIIKQNICSICTSMCIDDGEINKVLLISLKNRGKLVTPSKDVIQICMDGERIFRANAHLVLNKKNFFYYMENKIFQKVSFTAFNHETMTRHIVTQDVFNNHKVTLIKLIINLFLRVRINHESKCIVKDKSNLRQKYSRLVIFNNQ